MSLTSQPTGFNSTRREVLLETTEPPEDDDDVLVEYSIDTVSDEDADENEKGIPPKRAKSPRTPK
jgi:hypothetical protein